MKKYLIILVVFLLVGLLSPHISTVLCYFLLDKLECYQYITWLCDAYNSSKNYIVHQAFSILLYYIGYYGFVGTLCYVAEEKIMGKLNISSTFFNIFGLLTSIVVGIIIANFVGDYLRINDFFDYLYQTINNEN